MFFPLSRRVCQGCFWMSRHIWSGYPPCAPNLQSPKVFWLFGFGVSSVIWHPWRKPCGVAVEAPLLLMKPCPPALLISLTKTPKILILSFARPSFLRVLANLPGCKVVQCLQLRHVVFVDSAICTGGHQHAIIGSPRHRTHLQQMCGWKLQAKKNKKTTTRLSNKYRIKRKSKPFTRSKRVPNKENQQNKNTIDNQTSKCQSTQLHPFLADLYLVYI